MLLFLNVFPKSWLPTFNWIEASGLGASVRDSLWAFAVIESVHLLALAVMGGAVLIVDLRLFGLGLRRQPVRQIARDAEPWLISSLAVMLLTGFPLMASLAASKYYVNLAFQLKMLFLLLAIIFTFTVRRNVIYREDNRINPVVAWIVGLVSLFLWSGVGFMGRGIGFY
jgi:hypothetical protein